jgi:hypothetical protein
MAPTVLLPGPEADHATPSSRAVPVVIRVAALPRVIEIDGVLAPAAPARHAAHRTGSLPTWLPEWLRSDLYEDRHTL